MPEFDSISRNACQMRQHGEAGINQTLRQRGVGLIEVLVALLVLSLGLLGVAAMQAAALRNNHSAAERSMGAMLSHSIIESMRSNRAAALSGAYNLALPESGCVITSGGSLAQNDLRAWLQAMVLRDTEAGVRGVMSSSACGGISCSNAGLCQIRIRWDDCRGVNNPNDPCQTMTMITETQL
jgi:type IV pilus assembly protein PilV